MTGNSSFDSEECNKAALLSALQTHGEQFMQSFGLRTDSQVGKRVLRYTFDDSNTGPILSPDASEEWFGMSTDDCFLSSDPRCQCDIDFNDIDNRHSESPSSAKPELVVYSGEHSAPLGKNKSQLPSFMSSKVSKLGIITAESTTSEITRDVDFEKEKSHTMNDALLQRLVHTQLLNPTISNLNLKPSQKRKEIAGRVLELTGQAKVGKGESTIRHAEKSKAIRKIREGMEKKRKQRVERNLQEAKDTGDYHPIIKKLFDSSDTTANKKRTRERGLKHGVGRFTGGVLKLRKEEIASIQRRPSFVNSKNSRSRKSGIEKVR